MGRLPAGHADGVDEGCERRGWLCEHAGRKWCHCRCRETGVQHAYISSMSLLENVCAHSDIIDLKSPKEGEPSIFGMSSM